MGRDDQRVTLIVRGPAGKGLDGTTEPARLRHQGAVEFAGQLPRSRLGRCVRAIEVPVTEHMTAGGVFASVFSCPRLTDGHVGGLHGESGDQREAGDLERG